MAVRSSLLPQEILAIARLSQHLAFSRSRFASTSHLPRVAQSSLWQSITPKFLRNWRTDSQGAASSKEWSPVTPIIFLGILVGSQAIHIINLKNSVVSFSRQTDAKLALLREVIRRVQAGEDVDVEKVLGTGDPKSEREWEEVMREVETDDHLWQEKKWKARRRAKAQQAAEEGALEDVTDSVKMTRVTTQPDSRPRFY